MSPKFKPSLRLPVSLMYMLWKPRRAVRFEITIGSSQPNKRASRIARCAGIYAGFVFFDVGDAADSKGGIDHASFRVEHNSCVIKVFRDCIEFLVVAQIDGAGYADDIRPVSLRHALKFCGFCLKPEDCEI